MKNSEVPQDKSNLKDSNIKELCYAVDENGDYITVNSTGWDPKTIALNNAIEDINERIEAARQRVIENKTSPIEYYMEVNKMDINILSSYVGLWKWKVKRHFKPKVFKKLPQKTLQKYANVFNINCNQLKDITLPNGN
ncbi:hypothetical protein [Lacinutrix sp. 5H-3-7-4]|uniref:hypothetical protein n=1 Tax=Lacinutrix sp. (strain 5H-3-7-4) TaxID=983544 RepID=UPI00020A3D14|nr:hypothetical protein [Lacinutrix sp. 5H-3-7-4]AEH01923.1 hypothetical protein Lacal_2077 [Lacinutrix sp. 5H-3-7-4]